jgi:hypothetical protein
MKMAQTTSVTNPIQPAIAHADGLAMALAAASPTVAAAAPSTVAPAGVVIGVAS